MKKLSRGNFAKIATMLTWMMFILALAADRFPGARAPLTIAILSLLVGMFYLSKNVVPTFAQAHAQERQQASVLQEQTSGKTHKNPLAIQPAPISGDLAHWDKNFSVYLSFIHADDLLRQALNEHKPKFKGLRRGLLDQLEPTDKWLYRTMAGPYFSDLSSTEARTDVLVGNVPTTKTHVVN